jgi:hypothetical protein
MYICAYVYICVYTIYVLTPKVQTGGGAEGKGPGGEAEGKDPEGGMRGRGPEGDEGDNICR